MGPCTGWGLAHQHLTRGCTEHQFSGPLGDEVGEGWNVSWFVKNGLEKRAGCSICYLSCRLRGQLPLWASEP